MSVLALGWLDVVLTGYNEHYPAHSASLNTTYIVTITYAGDNSWNVYEHGGSPLGVSVSNNSSSAYLNVGEEMTDTTAQGAAVHSDLWYEDTSSNFQEGWVNGVISADNPPAADWISQNNSMRAYSNCTAPSAITPTCRGSYVVRCHRGVCARPGEAAWNRRAAHQPDRRAR